jgi:DNA-3-methyladenine glycosylase I
MAELAAGLQRGEDGVVRCWWPGTLPLYVEYHDTEWGRPLADDTRLFEKICLEGFQSGLSWITILKKRPAFRAAFAGFDIEALTAFGPADVERLMGDAGIVRHRGKIESVLNNARRARALKDEFGSIARFVWRFEPDDADRPTVMDHATALSMPRSKASEAMSKELRKRGWSFVGATTLYAFMQSSGLVNDHLEGCAIRPVCEAARQAFKRP